MELFQERVRELGYLISIRERGRSQPREISQNATASAPLWTRFKIRNMLHRLIAGDLSRPDRNADARGLIDAVGDTHRNA